MSNTREKYLKFRASAKEIKIIRKLAAKYFDKNVSALLRCGAINIERIMREAWKKKESNDS